jgi:hypothetical protein
VKLPEDKQERIKIFALIGIGVVFVLYLAFSYGLKPLQDSQRERRAKVDTLDSEIRKADAVIRSVSRSREENVEIVNEILDLAVKKRYCLRARLGNYLLGATERLESAALRAGVKLKSVNELGISDPPAPGDRVGSTAFRIYTARVTAEMGLHDLHRLLSIIESGNPLLCVGSLNVTGAPQTPAQHRVQFDVHWPVWRDDGHAERIRASAQLLEGEEAAPPGEGGGS